MTKRLSSQIEPPNKRFKIVDETVIEDPIEKLLESKYPDELTSQLVPALNLDIGSKIHFTLGSFHERQKYYSTTSVKTLAYYREKLSFLKRRKYYSSTPVHAPKLGNLSFSERSKAGLTALVKSERSRENFSYQEEPKAELTTLVKAEQFHENLRYSERPRTDLTTLVKGANIMAPMKKSLKVEVKTEL